MNPERAGVKAGMDASAGQAGAAPTSASERIGLLDALRGLALAGIFLVNIEWFSRPWQEFGHGMALGLAGIDLAVAWVVHVLVSGKFWVLFSLLFGMGFAVMMERASASGRGVRIYLRRLSALLVFGVAHALLLWVGDILHGYAIAGLLLLMLRNAAPSVQLALGLTLYLGIYALSLMGALLLMVVPPDMMGITPESLAGNARAGEVAAAAYAGGGFVEVTAQRVQDFGFLLSNIWGVVPMALGVFLIGSWLLRTGYMADVAGNRRFFARMAAWCLPAGLVLTLWSAAIATGHPEGAANGTWVLAMSLHGLGALPVTLGGVALLALAWESRAGARLLGALAPAGRMALTNYLFQSLVGSLVFYGYGLAMWGRLGPAAMAALALGVFALQVVASRWWLARFRFGPVEWLWRWLTYGARPPMRRAAPAA